MYFLQKKNKYAATNNFPINQKHFHEAQIKNNKQNKIAQKSENKRMQKIFLLI